MMRLNKPKFTKASNTMADKLKNLERGMEPPPAMPHMPGRPQDMLRGMDNLFLFKKQLLQPPTDPDEEAMAGTERRLTPIRHENKSYRYAAGGKVR